MVMLSNFLRFQLSDERRRTGRLLDVVVDPAAGDYPPVSSLLVRSRGKQPSTLAWEQVRMVDWRRRRVVVRDLDGGRAAPAEALVRTVLAKRDIMDALVVDVGGRQTLRANDLWFRETGGQLWLAGADASPWAVIRRLGRGLLGRGREPRLVDWKDLELYARQADVFGPPRWIIGRLTPYVPRVAPHWTSAAPAQIRAAPSTRCARSSRIRLFTVGHAPADQR